MKHINFVIAIAAVVSFSIRVANAEPNVVVSIKPIHSLVSAVMQGRTEPYLIIQNTRSPHTFSLKPSEAVILANAEVVFWVGVGLEPFLRKPVKTIANNAISAELMRVQGLTRFKFRNWRDLDKHAVDGHDEKGEAVHNNRSVNYEHSTIDPHVWLDPLNAKVLVQEIKRVLVDADPDSAERYALNAEAIIGKLDKLLYEVRKILQPVKGKSYFVFHDAYQYFEKRFGISTAGFITAAPEGAVGARRLADIRTKLKKYGPTCVFAEPQFETKLVSLITEGTKAKTSVIDPLGAELKAGPELYFSLIRNMAVKIRNCLSEVH